MRTHPDFGFMMGDLLQLARIWLCDNKIIDIGKLGCADCIHIFSTGLTQLVRFLQEDLVLCFSQASLIRSKIVYIISLGLLFNPW